MDREYAEYLLKKTKEDYNLIAEDYARTRTFTWDIEEIKQYLIPGERILDLGCGNGRLLKVLDPKRIDYIGVDVAEKLIEIAKRDYPGIKFQLVDPFYLPFPDNYFDKVFSIRTFHHLPSPELRIKFLKEVKRVLKPEGKFILSVWYAWSPKALGNFFHILKFGFLKLIGLSKLDFGDAFLPWGKNVQRYYHFFSKKELKNLLLSIDFKIKELKIICRPPELIKILKGKSCDIFLVAQK